MELQNGLGSPTRCVRARGLLLTVLLFLPSLAPTRFGCECAFTHALCLALCRPHTRSTCAPLVTHTHTYTHTHARIRGTRARSQVHRVPHVPVPLSPWTHARTYTQTQTHTHPPPPTHTPPPTHPIPSDSRVTAPRSNMSPLSAHATHYGEMPLRREHTEPLVYVYSIFDLASLSVPMHAQYPSFASSLVRVSRGDRR